MCIIFKWVENQLSLAGYCEKCQNVCVYWCVWRNIILQTVLLAGGDTVLFPFLRCACLGDFYLALWKGKWILYPLSNHLTFSWTTCSQHYIYKASPIDNLNHLKKTLNDKNDTVEKKPLLLVKCIHPSFSDLISNCDLINNGGSHLISFYTIGIHPRVVSFPNI